MSAGASFTVIKQNQYIRLFRSAGALSNDNSISLRDIGISCESLIFKHMTFNGVFIRSADQRYHMDEKAARTFCRKRNITISTLFLILMIILFSVSLLGAN